jgi:hypothetical protein
MICRNSAREIVPRMAMCKITGGDLTTTDEASAFRWATDAEVADLTEEAYAVRVVDALHDDRPAAVRHHDGVHLL